MRVKHDQKLWALIICSITGFVTPFMGSSMTIALPRIGEQLNMQVVWVAWVATAYNLSAAMFLLPLGRLADLKGREKIFKIGLGVFALFSLLCAVAWNSSSLIGFRFLQGLGGGMIFGTSGAILASFYPREQRGKAFGIYTSSNYLGNSLGPVLGGFVTQYAGWRGIFGIAMFLSVMALGLAILKLNNKPIDTPGKIDMPGSMSYSISLVLIMIGLSKMPALWAGCLVLAGVAGLIGYGAIELKTESPMLDLRAFRGNYAFIFSNVATLIDFTATFAVSFLVNMYLQLNKHMPPHQAGLTLVILSLTTAVISTWSGKLSDKMNSSIIASIGLGINAIGLTALTTLNENSPLWYIVSCIGLIGIGTGLFSSPNTHAVMAAADKKDFGVASASFTTMRTLGMNLSMGLIMMLFSITMGQTRITPAYSGPFLHCFKIAFCIFAALCAVGVFASWPRGRSRQLAGARFMPDASGFGLLIAYRDCGQCRECEIACMKAHNGEWGMQVKDGVPIPSPLCDMCVARIERGEQPICVENCPMHHIHFGTLQELTKEMAQTPGSMVFRPR